MAEEKVNNFVDLDTLDATLVQEEIQIDPDVNPLEAPAPIDDGTHRFKILLDSKSWEQKETKEMKDGSKRTYLSCKYRLQAVAPGTPNDNKLVFPDKLNTLVFDGKNEMAYLIRMILGDTADARAYVASLKNGTELAKAFQQVAASEPIVRSRTKWVAQYKDGEKNGYAVYKTALSGQNAFPSDGKGGHKHVIIHAQSGQEIVARAVVQDFFPD